MLGRATAWAGALLLAAACSKSADRAEGVTPAAGRPADGAAGALSSGPTDASFALPDGARVVAVEVDARFVYVIASDALYRMPKAGGDWARVSAAEHWVHGLSAEEGSAYFIEGNRVTRLEADKDAPAPLHELIGTARVWSLGARARRLAVVAPGCGSVMTLDVDGGSVESATQEVSDAVGGAVPVAVGAEAIYCSGGIGGVTSSRIFRYRPGSGALELFVDLGPIDAQGYAPEATAIVELGDQVYFTRGYGVMRQRHSLEVVPTSGGTPMVRKELDALAPHDLRHHAGEQALYWLSVSEPFIVKYSLQTGAVTTKTLAGLPHSSLALDDAYLYWCTDGTLERAVVF